MSATAPLAPRLGPTAKVKTVQRAVYVGTNVDEIGNMLAPHVGKFDMQYKTKVVDAMQVVRAGNIDLLLVDLRSDQLAAKLLVPLILAHAKNAKLVVLCEQRDVRSNLAVPGVARVIAAPLRATQILRLFGLEAVQSASTPETQTPADTPEAEPKPEMKKRGFSPFAFGMNLVSNLYKRAAFVLLAALFSAFSFYGLLIVFFLGSSGWGAPLTLVRGHELVVKAEAEIAQQNVNLNLAEQRLSEMDLLMTEAERNKAEAKETVASSIQSISMELRARQSRLKATASSLKRLQKTVKQYSKSGASSDSSPERLYSRRLISKKQYESMAVSSLELNQRMDSAASEIEMMQVELDNQAISIEMLRALKSTLEGRALDVPASAPPDLLLLAKQALDARALIKTSDAQMKAAKANIVTLQRSKDVLMRQINDLQNSPPGRAVNKRIDVLFVPYSNLASFSEGAELVSCRMTIFLCAKAGKVGKPLPGETSFVHPFFGKPIRGVFVDVTLTNPEAAAREIIHAKRAPLFL